MLLVHRNAFLDGRPHNDTTLAIEARAVDDGRVADTVRSSYTPWKPGPTRITAVLYRKTPPSQRPP